MAKDYNVYARLTAADEEVPISALTIRCPEKSIGEECSAECANPEQALPEGDVNVEIGIDSGDGIEWVTVMGVGRVLSSAESVEFAADGSNFAAVSALAQKWDLSPERPTILYDPDRVDPITSTDFTFGELVDEDHQPILPQYVPINGLDLVQLLRYVYVDKLGFSDLVTNIDTYALDRKDLPLESSFHAAVSSEVGLFSPEYFSDDDEVLWILDPQGAIPAGLPKRTWGPDKYVKATRTTHESRLVTSVILAYRDNTTESGGDPTARVEQETTEVGAYGTVGWQRTRVTRSILDFHDNPSDPDEVTRSVTTGVTTEVWARADGLVRIVLRDTQQDVYAYDYRLKTGLTKEVRIYTALPGLSASLRLVQTETKQIAWEQLSSTEFIKKSEVTQVTGSVLEILDDPDDPESASTLVSLYDANQTNDIPDDAEVLNDRPISTEIRTFRNIGRDQIEVNLQRVNYLTAQAAPSRTESVDHTGTIQVRAGGANDLQVRMLINNPDFPPEERRPPVVINAGDIPFSVARGIADRILDRQGQQPASWTIELAGLDLALRRGSLRTLVNRAGEEHTVFVTGYTITGSELGTPGFSVTMSVTGLEI